MTMPDLRPLSVGEILDVSFGMFRRLFGTLVTIQIVCGAVPLLLSLYIEGAGGPLAMMLPWLAYVLLTVVATSLAGVASVNVISEHYLGRSLAAGEALRRAVPYIGPVIVLSILSSFLVGVGLILLIVPGVIAFTGLMLSSQALVLEPGDSAIAAMRRSWALTRGNRLRMLGLLVTVFLLIYIPLLGVGVLAGIVAAFVAPDAAGAAGAADSTGFALVFTALGWAVQMLAYPILHSTLTVAYYDLRVRKEGFDLEVLASSLQTA